MKKKIIFTIKAPLILFYYLSGNYHALHDILIFFFYSRQNILFLTHLWITSHSVFQIYRTHNTKYTTTTSVFLMTSRCFTLISNEYNIQHLYSVDMLHICMYVWTCVLHLLWFSRQHTEIPAIFNAISEQFNVHISERDTKSQETLLSKFWCHTPH